MPAHWADVTRQAKPNNQTRKEKHTMAIANAVQKGSTVYIYDEKGRQLGTVSAGDGLHGFTSGSVSIRRGSTIHIYDEKGRQTGTTSAR
jgi:23S rRNA pseudoU1915 N3-methylase RlmH